MEVGGKVGYRLAITFIGISTTKPLTVGFFSRISLMTENRID